MDHYTLNEKSNKSTMIHKEKGEGKEKVLVIERMTEFF